MSETKELTLTCSMCNEHVTTTIEVPEGWFSDDIEEERNSLCPRHAIIDKFRDAQCPGCVSGWGECDLWHSYAFYEDDYEYRPGGRKTRINESDYATLDKGICPRRHGGTFMMRGGSDEFETLDLSEESPAAAGHAVAVAIREYVDKYGKRPIDPRFP